MSFQNSYSVTYQNDLLHSYMVVKLSTDDTLIDYQIDMIKENPILQFLALHKRHLDHESFLYYDITSKVTLEQFLSRKVLSKHEFLSIVKSLIKGLQLGRQYLLKGGSYMLRSDRIYIEPSGLELSLAYLPIEAEQDLNEEVKLFVLDLVVYKASFIDRDEGDFVYMLLNLLRSDSFSVKSLEDFIYLIALEKLPDTLDNNPQQLSYESSIRKSGILQKEKPALPSNSLVVTVLVQLFFIALGALIVRYINGVQGEIQYETIGGIALILAAIDFLLIKKLQPHLLKQDSISRRNQKKPQVSQIKKGQRASASGIATYVDNVEQGNLASQALETSILQQREPSSAYLLCCNENSNERVPLNKSNFLIGRIKTQVDFAPQNNAVGKLHAEILLQEGLYYIKDLNSRNGTYINGVKISSNTLHSIKHMDIIAFANSEYRFIVS